MKIIFTLDTIGTSGTEQSILNLLKHFSSDIEVIVVNFYPRDVLRKEYEATGARTISIGLSNTESWWKGILPFRKIILNEKPDLVVSSILRSNLISRIACYMTGTKLVGTFVSDSYSDLRMSSFSKKQKIAFNFYYWLDRFTAGIPKFWISNSEYIKKSNCEKLKVRTNKVKVIYRGRNPQTFPIKVNKLNEQPFRFIFLGRLLETKGLNELLDAFHLLTQEFPDVILDIYGDGVYRNSIVEKMNKYQLDKKVLLYGEVPEGWKKLYEADCFVFPSWYEGFSGSLVEAMMVGIPIIASDIPMNTEAVEHEKTALVFKVRDTHSLLFQMKRMITDYTYGTELATQARKEAEKRFDIHTITQSYEQVLRAVANGSNPI